VNINQQKAATLAIELADAMARLADVESARCDETPARQAWIHCRLGEWRDARQIASQRVAALTPGGRDSRRWKFLGQVIDLADRGSSAVAGGAIIEREGRQLVIEIRARIREMLTPFPDERVCHDEWRGPDGRLGHHSIHDWSPSDPPGFGYH
jgi:hypothetical protein